MWSKTRKALYERTADSLKSRINYEFYMKKRSYMDRALYIQADQKRCFVTTPKHLEWEWLFRRNILNALNIPYSYEKKTEEFISLLVVKYVGEAEIDFVMRSIHLYLNEYSFEECLSGENYFVYLLALLDRRLGKRRLRKIYDNMENEPEWIRKFILLRAEAEHIC